MRHLKTVLILVLAFSSCRSAKDSSLQKLVSGKLENATLEYNTSKDHVLCFEDAVNSASGVIKFMIVRVNDQSVIEEGNFRPGYIKWINDNEIEIRSLPGFLKDDNNLDQYTRVISVRKK